MAENVVRKDATLPQGFVLDPSELPQGFAIDSPPATPQAAMQPEQGLGDKLTSRASNFWQALVHPSMPTLQGKVPVDHPIPDPLQVLGQVGGAMNDVIGAGVSALYRGLMPESAQKYISNIPNTEVGKPVFGALQKVGQAYEQNVPPGIRELATDALNTATIGPTVKGIASLERGIVSTTKKVADKLANVSEKNFVNAIEDMTPVAQKNLVSSYDAKIGEIVDKGINKGIRPTVVGKHTYGRTATYREHARTAVEDIIKNGETPQNVGEFSQALENGVDRAVAKRTALAQAAGQQGASVTGEKTLATLKNIIDDTTEIPSLRAKAQEMADWITENVKNGPMTPVQTQKLIKSFNTLAKEWYVKGDLKSSARIINEAGNGMREEMLSALDTAGPEYQALGREIRNYMQLEKEVAHRWQVTARKSNFGFFDISNTAVAYEYAKALATLNPLAAAEGTAIMAAKHMMKRMNDSDLIIKGMFEDAAKYVNRKDKLIGIINSANTSNAGSKVYPASPWSSPDAIARAKAAHQETLDQIQKYMMDGTLDRRTNDAMASRYKPDRRKK